MDLQRNPLLQTDGLPQFDQILPSHVTSAVRQAIREAEAKFLQLEKQDTSGWDDLMVPLADIHLRLSDVISPVGHLNGVRNSPELRQAYEEVQPEIVAFDLRMSQSDAMFQRVKRLSEQKETLSWPVARKRIIEKYLQNARLSGIELPAEKRKRFNEISTKLTQLSTDFSNHLLDATKEYSMILRDSSDITGLTAGFLSMAAQRFAQKFPEEKSGGAEKGPWLVSLDYPAFVPFMENSKRRDLRESLFRAFVTRASDGSYDNRPLIIEILRLRREQANLLGFRSYAELSLSRKMAGEVSRVYHLLDELKDAAWANAQNELKELQTLAETEGITEPLKNWDIAYWAKRLQEKKFSFTDEDLKPYFPLSSVLDGLFSLVKRLFGIRVQDAQGETSVWHPDVRFYNIFDENNAHIASFFLDPYSRPENKRGGAWMDDCKIRYLKKDGSVQKPVAYLVCNSTPPVDGSHPALLTFREVETLFHEFGHGLQHMLTRVDDPDVSGINGVEWDAVELASQFMENWCYHRQTLMNMALHYQSGDALPEDLYQNLLASKTFRSASQMLRQVQISLLDMELHHNWDPESDSRSPFDIQAEIARKTSVMPPLKEDQFLCSFSHIFAGAYAAGYYSYKWAEVLSADAFAAFEDAGLENEDAVRKTGHRYRETILACGGSEHPMDVFRKFRGREPDTAALLRHSALTKGA
ncbi:MAG: M3 family metallopeptidase [Deltaproteobacteria bacterium]|nr:M3 family metallopeptidase [Deltaproteobacteria bacterium]